MSGLGYPDPIDQYANDIFYRKCSLLMYMIESKTQESKMDQILRKMFVEAYESN